MHSVIARLYAKSKHEVALQNGGTVDPPCATTSRQRTPIQNTKTFPVKALQLEPQQRPPVSDRDHFLGLKDKWFSFVFFLPPVSDHLALELVHMAQIRNCMQKIIFDKVDVPGPCLGWGPLWFHSCKRPPHVSDHSVFWVVAYGRFDCIFCFDAV